MNTQISNPESSEPVAAPKRRGRPPGSKNRPRVEAEPTPTQAAAPMPTSPTPPDQTPAGRTDSPASLIAELSSYYVERDSCIRALVVAAVAGCHSFILGPPGTAKSELARALARAFGGRYFEYLMTRFTVPDEIFGPIKLSSLKNDRFDRRMDDRLPVAEVAFIDEIWKSNSSILNSLLTILNEGVIHNDGQIVRVPLISAISASNEMPDGPELDAIYDRFMVRVAVRPIVDDTSFVKMLFAEPAVVRSRVDIRAEQERARNVLISPPVQKGIVFLRHACKKAGITVSDRRWRNSLKVLRASAHVDGRTEAALDDLQALSSVLWNKENEVATVAKMIDDLIAQQTRRADIELLEARRIQSLIRAAPFDRQEAAAWAGEMAAHAEKVRDIMYRISMLPADPSVDQAYIGAREIYDRIKRQVAEQASQPAQDRPAQEERARKRSPFPPGPHESESPGLFDLSDLLESEEA